MTGSTSRLTWPRGSRRIVRQFRFECACGDAGPWCDTPAGAYVAWCAPFEELARARGEPGLIEQTPVFSDEETTE